MIRMTCLAPVAVALVSFNLGLPRGSFAQDAFDASALLSQARQPKIDAFTIAVEVDQPTNSAFPDQGQSTRIVRYTVDRTVTASVWRTTQLPDPKFTPPGSPGYQAGDYDSNGNLIIWMRAEGAALSDALINDEYTEFVGYRVRPDGTSNPPGRSPLLVRHRPTTSNTESLGLLRRVFWALGRPWMDGLSDAAFERIDADGTRLIRARGWWTNTSGAGACTLNIDPLNADLVRRASFRAEGEAPRAQSRSEGIRRFGDVSLAERGEFSLESETIMVRLVSFSPTFDTNLVAEARKVISRARTSLVQVLDEREDPDHPKLHLVQAGDLDKEK